MTYRGYSLLALSSLALAVLALLSSGAAWLLGGDDRAPLLGQAGVCGLLSVAFAVLSVLDD